MEHTLLQADAHTLRRKRTERIARAILFGASSLAVVILAILIIRIVMQGLPALLDIDFFTQVYRPSLVEQGDAGIVDALLASLVVLLLTMVIAVPLGVCAAIYLTEYAKNGWFKRSVENWIANLAGVPSVVYGLLGLAVFVRFMQMGATMLAAAMTMALLVLPIVVVASQEALKGVPQTVREASFGLGATRWQTVRSHVLPNALPGILTGNILALSRAAGETAPLLILGIPVYMTLLGFAPTDPGAPLQLRIYFLSQDARGEFLEMAAGAIIVLVVATLLLNLSAILLRNRFSARVKW